MRPTLQEIADMPFPMSEVALETHYGVKPSRSDGDGITAKYSVLIEWTYVVEASETFEVNANSEDEAIEAAREECRNKEGDIDIIEARIIGAA